MNSLGLEVAIAATLEICKNGLDYRYRGSVVDLLDEVFDRFPKLKGLESEFDEAIEFLKQKGMATLHSYPNVRDFIVIKKGGSPAAIFEKPPERSEASTDIGDIFDNLFGTKKWSYQIVGSYLELGVEWLDEYIDANFGELAFGHPKAKLPEQFAPGSDRVVNFSHNQTAIVEKPLDDVIEKLEKENYVGENGLRELILGKLRAGRELIRASVFSIQSLYLTLIVGLEMLIEKYKDHAIGAVAGNLLALIIEALRNS